MKKLTIEDLKEMDAIDIERAYRAAVCFKAKPANVTDRQYPDNYAIACVNIKLIESYMRNRDFSNLHVTEKHKVAEPPFSYAINGLASKIYQQNVDAGWWRDSEVMKEIAATGDFDDSFLARMEANFIAAKIALMHSELSESLEGMRKDLMDDHLKHRPMIEVEFADAIIRILDTAEHLGLDVGGAIMEKLEYNKNRSDHKVENREKEGGKKI